VSKSPNLPVRLTANASTLAKQCEAALSARGLTVHQAFFDIEEHDALDVDSQQDELVLSMILETVPSCKEAALLGARIAAYARQGLPPVVLIPLPLATPKKPPARSGDEHAASLALLRGRGAIVLRDPNIWLECIVLLSAHGVPTGPNGAIVAEPGAWLAISASALQKRAEAVGERFSPSSASLDGSRATDFVLTDAPPASASKARVLFIPIAAVASKESGALIGLANALAAAEAAGQASRRISAGDGPASNADAPDDEFDEARFERQLDKLAEAVGDHECKVLLSSYGVSITRQAVATTPSAATRIAKKAGYPVEIKAWGAHQPSEPEGALVLTDVATAADVRRSYSTVCMKAEAEAVIIRETPMTGREVQVHFRTMGAVGLVCFLYQRGSREPVAALAPLRKIDAEAMARHVVASRAGDQDPDWAALASLLRNASYMVSANPRLVSVELNRVVVGNHGEGALVVDARARLSPSRN
tara:strand:+ start:50628 stop:52058 length:1431 start_codon:yes stop_codon:yes gene_type:complete